ncbi:MAG: ABC-F family ATP-binding cassette domain-containing protein [Opitutales bacterium]
MLQVSGITKAFGPRTLLQDASLEVRRGERVGLVGPNGAGKTTLFSLILGELEPDEGKVELERGARLGYLPQESAAAAEGTVLQVAAAISPELAAVYADLQAHPDPDAPEHHEALARFAELEGHAVEPRARRILSGLAFREEDADKPARTLSGGWIMRAHLARLLTMEPDLLMLDEPTNHLDLETLGWFEQHLRGYRGALLVISHDRAFLNAVCDSIVEIAGRKIVRYTGNYNAYLTQRDEREAQQWAAYKNQQREIAHHEDFIRRFRAKASKATQAQSRLRLLERMVRLEPPEPRAPVIAGFKFPQPARSAQKVAALENVEQAYGDHVVYRGLGLTLERGQRTVLVGPNGAGKSTLLKILAGLVEIRAGERRIHDSTTLGYFSQQRGELLDPGDSVLEAALAGPTQISEQSVRDLLGSFLFRGDDVHKKVRVLSGGEKSRLNLIRLLVNPPNLLLLDEPTTHLDIPSIDALIRALGQYTGTLVFVSHDVHFIRAIAQTVIHIQAGRLTPYAGDYDYYLHKSGAHAANTDARQATVAAGANGANGAALSNARPGANGAKPAAGTRPADQNPKAARKNAAENRRRLAQKRQEVSRLEKTVIDLETRQSEIAEHLSDPKVYADTERATQLRREAIELTHRLEAANAAWLDAATALEALTK